MYITIGRNPQSDIVISGYDVVSYDHATIEYDNGKFLFIDDSSNGTLINGQRINHESRPIQQGDSIMLAGVCMLNWEQVLAKVHVKNNLNAPVESGRKTMPHAQQPAYQQPAYQQPAYQQPAYQQPVYQQPAANQPQQAAFEQPHILSGSVSESARKRFFDREINSWNWGAFLLSWIWGIFNNVYWTLIALIPIPLVGLVVAIIAGVKGTRQSWENGKWQDADIEAFKKKQKGWAIAGFIVFGLFLLIPVFFWSSIIHAIAAFA